MAFPIKNQPMPHAPRGGGGLGTSGGGKPTKNPMPYDPPKGPIGIQSGGGKKSVHPYGTQRCD